MINMTQNHHNRRAGFKILVFGWFFHFFAFLNGRPLGTDSYKAELDEK